jgi:hypothetical protein
MTAGAYFLEPVETLTPAAMTRLRQIYEEGFPPFERAEFASITTARREDELALALVSDGQPAGSARSAARAGSTCVISWSMAPGAARAWVASCGSS